MIKYLFSLLFLCCAPAAAWAALAIEGFGVTDSGVTEVTSVNLANGNGTGNFTCTNNDTVLKVTGSIQESTATVTTVSTLTYNGLTLAGATLLASDTTPNTGTRSKTIYDYYWIPGAACDGAPHNLTMGISATRHVVLAIVSYTGANTTTPFDTPVAVVETNGTDSAVAACGAVTTEPGDRVFCSIALQNSGNTINTITNGTQIWQDASQESPGSANLRAAGASMTGTGSQVIQFNLSASTAWTTIAFNINDADVVANDMQAPMLLSALGRLTYALFPFSPFDTLRAHWSSPVSLVPTGAP